MTPTARQLQQRLEDRRNWFHHWLFQWHGLKDGRNPIQVDLFDGRKSFMGGIEFSGSARDVYWDAITRGVRKEILEQFAWVDEQVRRYNSVTAIRAIEECACLLVSFAALPVGEPDRMVIQRFIPRRRGKWRMFSAEVEAQEERRT